jgi:Dyp-type peroxidase family
MFGAYKTTPHQVLAALPAGSTLDLDDIQGDILLGLQKKFEVFVFFEIQDVKAFRDILRTKIAAQVTTTKQVRDTELELAELKRKGDNRILPLLGLNIAFTGAGFAKLQPGVTTTDLSFNSGAVAKAPSLGDPTAGGTPSTWRPEYLSNKIDGVLLITGGIQIDAEKRAAEIGRIFGTAIQVIRTEEGAVRPGPEAGHEHFGWKDGVSQPGITDVAVLFPGQRGIEPGNFLFGVGASPVQPIPAAPALTKNGSFLVFRRLIQKVPEFNQFVDVQSAALGVDPVLLGARLVGRWKSGAPLDLTPVQDDPETGANPDENNDFDFSTDQRERRCPFGAHIRKTNPRSDFDPVNPDKQPQVDVRRVMRQGIPFGPEVSDSERQNNTSTEDRGLLFVCYQSQIANQFEFLQINWADNPRFISPIIPKPANAPVTVGADPIIGRPTPLTPNPEPMEDPVPNYPVGTAASRLTALPQFVVPTGGAYCFSPSITALKRLL